MNIYNKLFILEYTKDPNKKQYDKSKFWYLNLSKKKYNYKHRDFDLYAYTSKYHKIWHIYDNRHRLIGPAVKYNPLNKKFYYIRDDPL